MLAWALIITFLTSFLPLVKAWEPDYILRVSEGIIHSDCAPRHSVLINGEPLPSFPETSSVLISRNVAGTFTQIYRGGTLLGPSI